MKRIVLNMGRQQGKSIVNRYWHFFNTFVKQHMKLKIQWREKGRLSLVATLPSPGPRGFELGLAERDLDPIHKWCDEHNCGIRTSFDTFRFRNQKEKTMFLLKWANCTIPH